MELSAEIRQTQVSELEALESVLRNGKLHKLSDWEDLTKIVKGFIQVDFDSIAKMPIELRGLLSQSTFEFSHEIKFLPPVRLVFKFPNNYPMVSSPIVNLSSDWMTEIQTIACQNAIEIVCKENEGMMVMYFCYQAVIETVDSLNIKFINLNRSYFRKLNPLANLREIRNQILLTIDKTADEAFASQTFDCQICFETVHGADCYKFSECEHVSCKNCVSGYYQNVARGLISSPFKCLEINCKTEANEELIRQALGEELFKKYDEALLQKAISEMGNTTECGRETCKMLAYVTDKDKNLVECSYCGFNFCHLCKQTYHGVSPCKIRSEDVAEIVEKWQEGDEEVRAELSRKYGGEKILEEWVNKVLNSQWMNANTKSCPGCDVNIEKSDGCNKMNCSKCNTTFCWLCESAITNGYQHFEQGGTCKGKLFEGLLLEDE